MKRNEKIGLTLVLIALGAVTGVGYNIYVGGNTIRYDVPLSIGDSVAASNKAIDEVLKNPEVLALLDAEPSRIIATQKFMVRGEAVEENGVITNSWYTILIGPQTSNGGLEIKGVYSVVVVTILYGDQSGYYIIYDTETGSMSKPIYSENVLQAKK
jgi:predicted small secreted protein